MSLKEKLAQTMRIETAYSSKAVDIEAGIYEVWISRQVEDRMGDVVVATGCSSENFMRNPVVLWSHDYMEPPIAKALALTIAAGDGVSSQFQFAPFGTSERSDTVHRLWRGGFLNAASIGFRIIKADPKEGHEDDWWPPLIIHEWELFEFSLVSIPANQDALRRSMKYLMTPAQRRREKRRVKERERNGREIAPVEPVVSPDSELLSSLSDMQTQLKNLRGVLNYGRSNQRAT